MTIKSYFSDGKGFTLVELMVVVAILGLLLSLIAPALKNGLDAAKQAACANKLRGMGVGLQFYLAETGAYPMASLPPPPPAVGGQLAAITWAEFLYPHMFQNPLPERPEQVGTEFSCPAAIPKPLSYQANTYVSLESGGNPYAQPLIKADVVLPASTIFVADARQSRHTFLVSNSHQLRGPGTILNADGIMPHGGQNNWLFCDGHVKRMHVMDTIAPGATVGVPRGMWTPDPND